MLEGKQSGRRVRDEASQVIQVRKPTADLCLKEGGAAAASLASVLRSYSEFKIIDFEKFL